ncbi:MAG: tetratricopeptide repeat protein [Alphaproteobacteria bacterium]
MRKILILSIAYIFFSTGVGFAQSAQFEVKSKVVEHYSKSVGDTGMDVKEKYKSYIVTLEAEKISVRKGVAEKIYDFTSDKLILVNHHNHTFIKTSLYAIPAFRDFENKRRSYLEKKAQESTGATLVTDPFYLEALFGDKPDSEIADKVKVVNQNDETQYLYGGDEVAFYMMSDYPLREGVRDSYKKYLVYEHNIHPIIWRDLSEKDVVFSSLSYMLKQVVPSLTEVNLSISDFVEEGVGVIGIPDGYVEEYSRNKRLNKVVKLSKNKKEKTIDEYFEEINGLVDKKKHMEASLLFHEYAVQTGGEGVEARKAEVQRIFSEAPKGSGVLDLTNAIRQQPKTKSKDQLQKAINIIDKERQRGDKHSYILNVYLANYLAMAGKTDEAKDLILQALENNPFLLAAYKDLGDKYFKDLDMVNAWASWDQMRRLNPDYMLSPHIDSFEQQIRKRHPVYFK